jgi:hypothetical protein
MNWQVYDLWKLSSDPTIKIRGTLKGGVNGFSVDKEILWGNIYGRCYLGPIFLNKPSNGLIGVSLQYGAVNKVFGHEF